MSGLICAGDVYLDRFDSLGNSTGLLQIGNATKFSIQEASSIKQRISRGRDTYGQAADAVSIKAPATIDMIFDEVNKDSLSMALLGTVTDLTASSGTVTTMAPEAVAASLGGLRWTAAAAAGQPEPAAGARKPVKLSDLHAKKHAARR